MGDCPGLGAEIGSERSDAGLEDAEDAAESVRGVFMGADGDGLKTHFHDRIIVAARLGHIAKVKHVGLLHLEFGEKVSHTELFVHAGGGDVDGSSAADFVEEVREQFAAAGDDGCAFLVVGVPGVFGLSAGLLTEGREGDLGEAVFNNLVALGELVSFPITEFASGLLQGLGDTFNVCGLQGVIIDLVPVVLVDVKAVILSALGDEEVKVGELRLGDAGGFQGVDDLNQELLEFLARDRADFEMVETAHEQLGDFGWYRGFGDIEGLVNVKG